jgi:hypothetical protein
MTFMRSSRWFDLGMVNIERLYATTDDTAELGLGLFAVWPSKVLNFNEDAHIKSMSTFETDEGLRGVKVKFGSKAGRSGNINRHRLFQPAIRSGCS